MVATLTSISVMHEPTPQKINFPFSKIHKCDLSLDVIVIDCTPDVYALSFKQKN